MENTWTIPFLCWCDPNNSNCVKSGCYHLKKQSWHNFKWVEDPYLKNCINTLKEDIISRLMKCLFCSYCNSFANNGRCVFSSFTRTEQNCRGFRILLSNEFSDFTIFLKWFSLSVKKNNCIINSLCVTLVLHQNLYSLQNFFVYFYRLQWNFKIFIVPLLVRFLSHNFIIFKAVMKTHLKKCIEPVGGKHLSNWVSV